MPKATEQDHLEFVRERLRMMSRPDLIHLAAQAGVTSRTLYYMIEKKFEGARYMTVMRIHKVITEADKADKSKGRRRKKAEATQ